MNQLSNDPNKIHERKRLIGHLKINGRPAERATKTQLAQVVASLHQENKHLRKKVESTRDAGIDLLKDFVKQIN